MFRTNFSDTQLLRYKMAIDEFRTKTGNNRLSIKSEAFDMFGEIVENTSSLHDSEDGDLSIFWNIFDKLKYKLNQIESSEMLENMQYYMEYCQQNGYISPADWIISHKHF